MDVTRLRRSVIVDEILEFAKAKSNERVFVDPNQDKVDKMFKKYFNEMNIISSIFWKKRRIYNKFCSVLIPIGGKKISKIVRTVKARLSKRY